MNKFILKEDNFHQMILQRVCLSLDYAIIQL